MTWPINPRPAKSLVTLQDQVNGLWPNRSRASDGMLGDAAHQAVKSEHNPNGAGVVTAYDITQDPDSGADMGWLSEQLINDDRTWYVIFNRRIWEDGEWTPYSGTSDPHTNHLHISTKQDSGHYDNARDWPLTKEGGDEVAASIVGDNELDMLSWAFFGYGASQDFIKQWRGTETNTMIRWMQANPAHADWLRHSASGDIPANREEVINYVNKNLK